MARKHKHPEHVNHERWLVSYADFITLLFAFFVVMFSVSQVDSQKMGRFVESVQSSFEMHGVFEPNGDGLLQDGAGDQGHGMPVVVPAMQLISLPVESGVQLTAVRSAVERILKDAKLKERIQVRMESRGLTISLPETGFFDAGSADLRPSALPVIRQLADLITPLPHRVLVEGHTDDTPIRSGTFPSNWELSTARATGVVRHLIQEAGFPPERLSAAGYAEYRPVASNITADGRSQNRRVDVVILGEIAPRVVDLSDSPERLQVPAREQSVDVTDLRQLIESDPGQGQTTVDPARHGESKHGEGRHSDGEEGRLRDSAPASHTSPQAAAPVLPAAVTSG